MIPVVFDCGVLLSAIGWPGNPRRCLVLAGHRRIRVCATTAIWSEYESVIPAVLLDKRPQANPRPTLNWLLTVAHFVEPWPLCKQRSRDSKDDPYLQCALAVGAEFIVSNDRDLLVLERPFGVSIVTPAQLLLRARAMSHP
jgi:putative PIN family toxin of toxin-antitoxin system